LVWLPATCVELFAGRELLIPPESFEDGAEEDEGDCDDDEREDDERDDDEWEDDERDDDEEELYFFRDDELLPAAPPGLFMIFSADCDEFDPVVPLLIFASLVGRAACTGGIPPEAPLPRELSEAVLS